MKKMLLFILPALVLMSLNSCTKDDDNDVLTYPIVGLWTGTFKVVAGAQDVGVGNLYYSFDLKADSTMLVQSLGADGNTYYSTGTWSLSGTAFTAKYTTTNRETEVVTQDAVAVYNKDNGSLSNGVITSAGSDSRFEFNLTRVN